MATTFEQPTMPNELPYYSLTTDEVCRELDVNPATGLSDVEVAERRKRYGPNKLAEEAKEPGWKAFLRQYKDLMQLVLVGGLHDGPCRTWTDRTERHDGASPGGQGG